MAPSKSQGDEFLINLFEKLLLDLTTRYPSEQKSFLRDAKTLRSRVLNEGVSFLTKTLPKLGKAFDRSLETHNFEIPFEFKKLKGDPNTPEFLQGLFKLCRCPDGSWDPIPGVVKDIRQVLFLVYKLELPYSAELEAEVISSFIRTEQELRSCQLTADISLITDVRKLIEELLSGFDPKAIIPRHGPGAVATGERLEEKWEFSRLYSGIHQEFPYYSYFMSGSALELTDRIKWYKSLSRIASGEAKVVLVPKDSRGPRLISCEPLEYQWIQQGVGRGLMRFLESHRLTKGHVNFIDQSINANLARESSSSREYATLDMKDASDRVSLDHIDLLFPERIRRVLKATRSASTKLPNGNVLVLKKFAPMGSALCFPVEALLFWAISVVATCRTLSIPAKQAGKFVYVYGDDIIVPSSCYGQVVKDLTSFNLKVNEDKSFKTGFFRESCGMDAFHGIPVTPTRLRTLWSGKPGDGTAFASYVEYANAFHGDGYDEVASFLFKTVENVYGKLPYGTPDSSYPNRNCHSAFYALLRNLEAGRSVRWNAHTNQAELKAYVLRGKKRPTSLDGWPRLLRGITSEIQRDPSSVALPRSAKLSLKWSTIS